MQGVNVSSENYSESEQLPKNYEMGPALDAVHKYKRVTIMDSEAIMRYDAHLLNEISLSAASIFADVTQMTPNMLVTILANALFKKTPAFSMGRHYLYKGVNPTNLLR
jgi:hypothetical protein